VLGYSNRRLLFLNIEGCCYFPGLTKAERQALTLKRRIVRRSFLLLEMIGKATKSA
jgi:hypothetical protein